MPRVTDVGQVASAASYLTASYLTGYSTTLAKVPADFKCSIISATDIFIGS
jgi:hypothetical protein